MTITTMAQTFSAMVMELMSPYPTVVIVVNAQYMAVMYLGVVERRKGQPVSRALGSRGGSLCIRLQILAALPFAVASWQ